MLDTLVASKTRIKLLFKFFLNSGTRAYLSSLAEEFGESPNAVRAELSRLSKAGLLVSESEGRAKLYRANTANPLFKEIHSLVKKFAGFDIIEETINKLGNVDLAFITGDYARGRDSGIIDIIIVGDINKIYLYKLIEIAEEGIKRKIRPLVLSQKEFSELENNLDLDKSVLIWNSQK